MKDTTIQPYKSLDFCYYLTANNKVRLAEVKKAHVDEKTNSYFYEIVDQKDFWFLVVHHDYCADTAKELKGKKR